MAAVHYASSGNNTSPFSKAAEATLSNWESSPHPGPYGSSRCTVVDFSSNLQFDCLSWVSTVRHFVSHFLENRWPLQTEIQLCLQSSPQLKLHAEKVKSLEGHQVRALCWDHQARPQTNWWQHASILLPAANVTWMRQDGFVNSADWIHLNHAPTISSKKKVKRFLKWDGALRLDHACPSVSLKHTLLYCTDTLLDQNVFVSTRFLFFILSLFFPGRFLLLADNSVARTEPESRCRLW